MVPQFLPANGPFDDILKSFDVGCALIKLVELSVDQIYRSPPARPLFSTS